MDLFARRLRHSPHLRHLLQSTRLVPSDFVAPLFIRRGENIQTPIPSMPGVAQLSPDRAIDELRALADAGIKAAILFGVTDSAAKDPTGSHAHDADNAVAQTLRAARDANLPLALMTDLCFCEYTSHGHCGILSPDGQSVDNTATVAALAQQSVMHAKAGADVIAPSAMMDNQVGAIRTALDAAGFTNTAILAYAVKYASAFYGPFRDAAESPPQFGDRTTYQMDYRRGLSEALTEARADIAQGADMLMVKPALPYLDVLSAVAAESTRPVAAYHVSGEYAMLKAAAANGWLDEKPAVLETMTALKRAGASFILTYYARQLAEWIA
jgi:porphobilinogen synthase